MVHELHFLATVVGSIVVDDPFKFFGLDVIAHEIVFD